LQELFLLKSKKGAKKGPSKDLKGGFGRRARALGAATPTTLVSRSSLSLSFSKPPQKDPSEKKASLFLMLLLMLRRSIVSLSLSVCQKGVDGGWMVREKRSPGAARAPPLLVAPRPPAPR
jgi:hypothetical protein